MASLSIASDLRLIIDSDRFDPIIQVFDRETGELIRQFPSADVSTCPRWVGAWSIRMPDPFV
jgi:hypothetical protein